MAKKKIQGDVRESAHKIWLAGLGALAVAEEEGSKLFKSLVEQGERFEAEGKQKLKEAKKNADQASDRARKVAEETAERAAAQPRAPGSSSAAHSTTSWRRRCTGSAFPRATRSRRSRVASRS